MAADTAGIDTPSPAESSSATTGKPKLWITQAQTPYGNGYGVVAVLAETRQEAIAKARPKIEASVARETYVPSQRYYRSLLDNLGDMREAEDGVFVDWTATCSDCGGPAGLSGRLGLPDGVDPARIPPGIDPYQENFMPLTRGECYMRALVRIPLVGKHPEMLYCVWLRASDADVRHVADVMWDDEPAYSRLTVRAVLANALPGLGFLGAQVTARVRDVAELPYVEESEDAGLARVLTEPQPYETAVPRPVPGAAT